MADNEEASKERVRNAFKKALNQHGYGFQYSVIKYINDSYGYTSTWYPEVAEFPTEIQGTGTRIDFILKQDRRANPFYLLAECKRANPALSNWCFARAPFVGKDRSSYRQCFVEKLEVDASGRLFGYAKPTGYAQNAFHIALEVKSGETGDTYGQGRGAIEEAATQVCRGLNGMVSFLAKNVQVLKEHKVAHLLPVIFTTAQLWSSNIDLNTADIDTGKLDFSGASFKNEKWVLYQYHLSPGIKHSVLPLERLHELDAILDSQYVRSIAIVNPSGIKDFLQRAATLDPK